MDVQIPLLRVENPVADATPRRERIHYEIPRWRELLLAGHLDRQTELDLPGQLGGRAPAVLILPFLDVIPKPCRRDSGG